MQTVAESTREYQRDTAAYIALAIAQANGCQVEFQDRATPDPEKFVKLWAVPGPERTRLSNDGALDEEITDKVFDIPRQLGCSCGQDDCPYIGQGDIYAGHTEIVLFPPETGVSVNAVVRFEGRDFSVKEPACDSLKAKYKLACEFHKPRRTHG